MAQEVHDEKKSEKETVRITSQEFQQYHASCNKVLEQTNSIIEDPVKNGLKLSQETWHNNVIECSSLGKIHLSIATKICYCDPNPKEPTMWYGETIIPVNIKNVFKAWMYPKIRLLWDTSITESKIIYFNSDHSNVIQDVNKDNCLFVLYNECAPAAGGLISPRQFVTVMKCNFRMAMDNNINNDENNKNNDTSNNNNNNNSSSNSEEEKNNSKVCTDPIRIEMCSHAMKHNDLAEKRGFVRGSVVASSCRMDRIDTNNENDKQILNKFVKCKDDKFKDNYIESLEWTRFWWITQAHVGGWVSDRVASLAMSNVTDNCAKEIRTFCCKNNK